MAQISITWHGHGTFALDVDGTQLIIDPFFAPNNPAATVTAADVAADFILVTHGHHDHTGDLISLATRTGAKVIGMNEIAVWARKQGVENTHGMNIGGGNDFDFGRLKLTLALHSSTLPDGTYGGLPTGLLLTIDGKNIYFAGDTGLFSDMSLIGAAGIDVAILPIGDNFTMGPEDALAAVKLIKPKSVIPAHYNTWGLIAVDVDKWMEDVSEQTSATPLKLVSGEPTPI